MSNIRFSLTKYLETRSLILASIVGEYGALWTGCIPSGKALVTDQRGTSKTSEVQRDLPESVATAIVYNSGMGGCKSVTNQALVVGGMQDVPPLRLRARIPGMGPLDGKRLAQLLQLAAIA